MFFWKPALFILFCWTVAWAQQPERRAMTTDDLLEIVRVGEGLISPDGQWILYSKSALDWKENKRKTTFHRVSADGQTDYQFLGEEGGTSPRFSPDGQFLAFLREVEKKRQIFVMRTVGGEALQWTKQKEAVRSFRWLRDSTGVLFVTDRERTKEEEKEHKAGADAIFVDEGPNGQSEGRWQHLWKIMRDADEAEKLTEQDFRFESYDPAPDGNRIVFTARRENRRNQANLAEIYLLELEGEKEVTRLTDNAAPEKTVRWSPDGLVFSYAAADDRQWELRHDKIWVMNPASRETKMVSGDFRAEIRQSFWSPDSQRLLFSGLVGTNTNVYELTVSSGQIRPLTDSAGTSLLRSVSADFQHMVLARSDFDSPPDLFLSPVERYEPVQLTRANAWVEQDLKLAQGRVVRWQSRDGLEIEGLLYLPPDYEEGSPLPLVLHIHGGPAGVFTNSFEGRYHVYGGLGYASLCPNVRGSRGYGDEFLRGNMFDLGGGDFEDLMSGVDAMVDRGFADPEKLGVRGWSYGGILGGWTITHTDRFKAASLGAMVSDWTSEFGPGFNYDVRLWYIGKTPWENPESYRARSALTHAPKVTTPTLLLHGMRDTTDTEAQSMMFFTALRELGKTVRYIRFPREPHGFREPRHQRVRDIEELKWMQKYVLGIDWQPWSRPVLPDEDEEKEESSQDSAAVTSP